MLKNNEHSSLSLANEKAEMIVDKRRSKLLPKIYNYYKIKYDEVCLNYWIQILVNLSYLYKIQSPMIF